MICGVGVVVGVGVSVQRVAVAVCPATNDCVCDRLVAFTAAVAWASKVSAAATKSTVALDVADGAVVDVRVGDGGGWVGVTVAEGGIGVLVAGLISVVGWNATPVATVMDGGGVSVGDAERAFSNDGVIPTMAAIMAVIAPINAMI